MRIEFDLDDHFAALLVHLDPRPDVTPSVALKDLIIAMLTAAALNPEGIQQLYEGATDDMKVAIDGIRERLIEKGPQG